MLKRRKEFQLKFFFLTKYQEQTLSRKVINSLQQNKFQSPEVRMLAFKRTKVDLSANYYFTARYRKQCFLNFSYRVPVASLGVSRFILVRGADKLIFGPYRRR